MKVPFERNPNPLPSSDKKGWSIVYTGTPRGWLAIDQMATYIANRPINSNGYQLSDFKDMKVLELNPTPEEREIVESWLVSNREPLQGASFYLPVAIPPAIYSRGRLNRDYDNPDPSIFRGAFISDEKYLAFLESLQEGKYELDLEFIHVPLQPKVTDLLRDRIKILRNGVEVTLTPLNEED